MGRYYFGIGILPIICLALLSNAGFEVASRTSSIALRLANASAACCSWILSLWIYSPDRGSPLFRSPSRSAEERWWRNPWQHLHKRRRDRRSWAIEFGKGYRLRREGTASKEFLRLLLSLGWAKLALRHDRRKRFLSWFRCLRRRRLVVGVGD
jgi:hypothetical protein